MARLFSQELAERALEACNSDSAYLGKAELLTGTMVLRAWDTPDEMDARLSYRFDRGNCRDYDFRAEPAPSAMRQGSFRPGADGLVRISAPYRAYVAIDQGELEPADALASDEFSIEGSKLVILPRMQAITAWLDLIRGLEKSY